MPVPWRRRAPAHWTGRTARARSGAELSADYKGLTVSFDRDLSEDQVKRIQELILTIRGVQNVTLLEVDSGDWVNRARIVNELRRKIGEALDEGLHDAR